MTWSQSLSSPASGRTLLEVIGDPERLAAVAGTALIEDRRPDPVLYRLARQARRVLDVPTVFLSVLDDDRQYFAAADGLSASLTAAGSTPLSHAFCLYTVGQGKALVVPDARVDERLAGNPAIAEHGMVAYVGVPVFTAERQPIGALCATDVVPRFWSLEQVGVLHDLAAEAALRLEQRTAQRSGERG
jgi:GAF domain-containing protein